MRTAVARVYHVFLSKFRLQISQSLEFDAQFEGAENGIDGGKSDQRRARQSSVRVDSRHGVTQRILEYAPDAVVASASNILQDSECIVSPEVHV